MVMCAEGKWTASMAAYLIVGKWTSSMGVYSEGKYSEGKWTAAMFVCVRWAVMAASSLMAKGVAVERMVAIEGGRYVVGNENMNINLKMKIRK